MIRYNALLIAVLSSFAMKIYADELYTFKEGDWVITSRSTPAIQVSREERQLPACNQLKFFIESSSKQFERCGPRSEKPESYCKLFTSSLRNMVFGIINEVRGEYQTDVRQYWRILVAKPLLPSKDIVTSLSESEGVDVMQVLLPTSSDFSPTSASIFFDENSMSAKISSLGVKELTDPPVINVNGLKSQFMTSNRATACDLLSRNAHVQVRGKRRDTYSLVKNMDLAKDLFKSLPELRSIEKENITDSMKFFRAGSKLAFMSSEAEALRDEEAVFEVSPLLFTEQKYQVRPWKNVYELARAMPQLPKVIEREEIIYHENQ
jgi:hypothetical protein